MFKGKPFHILRMSDSQIDSQSTTDEPNNLMGQDERFKNWPHDRQPNPSQYSDVSRVSCSPPRELTPNSDVSRVSPQRELTNSGRVSPQKES